MRTPHPFLCILALAILCLCTPVFAQTTTGTAAGAKRDGSDDARRELLKSARQLAAASQYEQAARLFEDALAISPDPIVAVQLADCHRKLGKLLRAVELLDGVVAAEPSADARKDIRENHARARTLRDQTKASIPTLTIQLDAPGEDVKVLVDGLVLDRVLLGVPVKRDPGQYRVTVEAPGRDPSNVEVILAEGQGRTITALTLAALPPPPAPALPPPPPSPPPLLEVTPPRKEKSSVVPYVSFGIGAAGLVVGGTAGIVTMLRAPNLQCPDQRCTGQMAEYLRTTRIIASVANIGIGVGLVGCTIGTISLLSSGTDSSERGHRPKASAVALRIGPGMATIEGELP